MPLEKNTKVLGNQVRKKRAFFTIPMETSMMDNG